MDKVTGRSLVVECNPDFKESGRLPGRALLAVMHQRANLFGSWFGSFFDKKGIGLMPNSSFKQ